MLREDLLLKAIRGFFFVEPSLQELVRELRAIDDVTPQVVFARIVNGYVAVSVGHFDGRNALPTKGRCR